jgi:hypothetical protein
LTAVLILVCVLATWVGAWWWKHRQWFDLQQRQLATIERIGEFSPVGWDRDAWKNALVTPYNVWGNVTFHPDYSRTSNKEMRTLLRKLEQIVAETTPTNSMESVDRVFQLLLQRGRKTQFISGYRDEFRTYGDVEIPSHRIAEPSHALESASGADSKGQLSPPDQ